MAMATTTGPNIVLLNRKHSLFKISQKLIKIKIFKNNPKLKGLSGKLRTQKEKSSEINYPLDDKTRLTFKMYCSSLIVLRSFGMLGR